MTTNLSNLRCAVLGAGGFIGTNLCRALTGKTQTLRAFGRRQSFPGAISGCDWITGDFTDPTALSNAISGCDTVFHLVNATTPASANADKLADLNANVASTIQLLDICRESGVKRIIFVSSGGTIYGLTKSIPIPETAPTDPICAYGISKLAIEKYLSLYNYLHDIDYRILRVSNPFGPFQTSIKNQGVIAAFLRQALAGKPIELWGDGRIIRDYIFIDDVVDSILLATTHQGSNKIFNIGSGEGKSLNEIVKAIEKSLGKTLEVNYQPARSVDVPINILDNTLANENLNWKPTVSFAEGLQKTIHWLQAQT